jgi:hypothetical protein
MKTSKSRKGICLGDGYRGIFGLCSGREALQVAADKMKQATNS